MDINLLKQCGKTVIYQGNQIICREGDQGHSMFVLLEGEVEITINSYSNKSQSLGILPPGSFFGEMSMLEKKPRSATVTAISDLVMLLEISEPNFSILLNNAPSITYRLLITLNQRLNAMLDRIWKNNERQFVHKYRKEPLYCTIQKLDGNTFQQIAKSNPTYVWELLKYLSCSLENLNKKYIKQIEE